MVLSYAAIGALSRRWMAFDLNCRKAALLNYANAALRG